MANQKGGRLFRQQPHVGLGAEILKNIGELHLAH